MRNRDDSQGTGESDEDALVGAERHRATLRGLPYRCKVGQEQTTSCHSVRQYRCGIEIWFSIPSP
jgi:hypothetical protein